jgi:hypothetical protein
VNRLEKLKQQQQQQQQNKNNTNNKTTASTKSMLPDFSSSVVTNCNIRYHERASLQVDCGPCVAGRAAIRPEASVVENERGRGGIEATAQARCSVVKKRRIPDHDRRAYSLAQELIK